MPPQETKAQKGRPPAGDLLTSEAAQPNKRQRRARNRFLMAVFLAGTVVPFALMTYVWLAGTNDGGASLAPHGKTSQWVWFAWPTWVLLFDAEHPGTFVFMLVVAALANGLWYTTVGATLWYVSEGLRRLAKRQRAIRL